MLLITSQHCHPNPRQTTGYLGWNDHFTTIWQGLLHRLYSRINLVYVSVIIGWYLRLLLLRQHLWPVQESTSWGHTGHYGMLTTNPFSVTLCMFLSPLHRQIVFILSTIWSYVNVKTYLFGQYGHFVQKCDFQAQVN